VALIWLGALAAVLAARTGIETGVQGISHLKLVASVVPAHAALVASWWVVRDRARKPAAVLPRGASGAAWLARALGWVTVVQLGVVVLVLFVDPPIFVATARAAAAAAVDPSRSFEAVMGTFRWSHSASALLACAATVAPIVAGLYAKRVLRGGNLRPLRGALLVSAVAYGVVLMVLSPSAWRETYVPQWIADIGFLLGGFAAPFTREPWHMRAAAWVASSVGLAVSIAAHVALGRSARARDVEADVVIGGD